MNVADLKETAPASLRRESKRHCRAPIGRATGAAAPAGRGANRRSSPAGSRSAPCCRARSPPALFLAYSTTISEQKIVGEVVTAHLRSLQPGPSDRRRNKRPAYGQAVVQRQARRGAAGGRSHGARLYADRRTARRHRRRDRGRDRLPPPQPRDQSVCRPGSAPSTQEPASQTRHGFNVRHWSEEGLDFWAVSDIDAAELDEFARNSGCTAPATPAFLTGLGCRYRLNNSQEAIEAPRRKRGRGNPLGAPDV